MKEKKEKKEKQKKQKIKTVYLEDKGETVYSMAALEGRTPEEQEEFEKKRRMHGETTKGEKRAMIAAAFTVYGPLLLCVLGSFLVAAILLYFFLK